MMCECENSTIKYCSSEICFNNSTDLFLPDPNNLPLIVNIKTSLWVSFEFDKAIWKNMMMGLRKNLSFSCFYNSFGIFKTWTF